MKINVHMLPKHSENDLPQQLTRRPYKQHFGLFKLDKHWQVIYNALN